jgi:two-component system chemotaxis response regulator CheY
MPRLSGMELLERLKRHPELKAVPFVLVTSANDEETVEQANESGAAGYIVKPFKVEQVRAQLSMLVGGAGGDAAHVAEAPSATLQRLGINAERLLVYLSGFQNQLHGANGELTLLLATGDQREVRQRLERLHAGCVTLGLHGAAAALNSFAPGALSGDEVQGVLADVIRSAEHQSAMVRQLAAV